MSGRPVEPRLLLTDFLRHRLGLTGTHVGCEHGVCGACTVLLDGVSVRGCCVLAVQADGSRVDTVESLAGNGPLSALQEAFRRHHALQCGFCTPGILMAATDLLSRGTPTRDEIVDLLSGHLCRCTGYAPIVDAIEEVSPSVNLARSLLAACERHPELEAFPGLPYGELLPRVRRIAGGLGVEPGDRVATVLDNRLETALLYWAAQWAGAVFVPLSWRLSEEELDYCLADCGAQLVVRDARPAAGRRRSTRARSTVTSARSRCSSTRPGRPAARRACRARMRPTAPAAGRRRCSTATRGAIARSA